MEGIKMEELLKRFTLIEVDKLVKAEWNYKEENEELSEKLGNNIKRNSQTQNIVVRELETGFYEVVDGNHRLDEFKKLGFQKVMACNLGKITTTDAQRMAIELNETKFESDNIKLAGLVKYMLEDYTIDELTQTMPYSKEELENFSKLLDFDWDGISKPEGTPSDGNDEFVDIKLRLPIQVMEQLNAQIDRFKKILHPEEKDLSKVSYVMAVEAMCQILAQTPDNNILGG